MNRDMTTREKIVVMQAYEDGKEIEFRSAYTEEEWVRCFKAVWNWAEFDYRIKPEPEYVPYDSVTEVDKDKWVKGKASGRLYRIIEIDPSDNTVYLDGEWYNLRELFKGYKDGTPCGKKVET